MRRCVICGQEKEDESFFHDKYAKDGISNVCRECNKKRAKKRRENIKKHLEELEKKLNDYVKITSISIDMSTEEAPDNRIYAKPIEKQGDVLLCEFESANYDIEQKALKEENKRLKRDVGNLGYKIKNQRHEIDNRLKEIEKLKDLLKECRPYVIRSATSRMIENSIGYKKDMKLLTKIEEVTK